MKNEIKNKEQEVRSKIEKVEKVEKLKVKCVTSCNYRYSDFFGLDLSFNVFY